MIQALLTIDDIPSDNTCAIVDYLNGAGIQAIMFAEGEKAEKNPEPAVYAVRHGMIVGNHSYSHQHKSSPLFDCRRFRDNGRILVRSFGSTIGICGGGGTCEDTQPFCSA